MWALVKYDDEQHLEHLPVAHSGIEECKATFGNIKSEDRKAIRERRRQWLQAECRGCADLGLLNWWCEDCVEVRAEIQESIRWLTESFVQEYKEKP